MVIFCIIVHSTEVSILLWHISNTISVKACKPRRPPPPPPKMFCLPPPPGLLLPSLEVPDEADPVGLASRSGPFTSSGTFSLLSYCNIFYKGVAGAGARGGESAWGEGGGVLGRCWVGDVSSGL